jgi:hypothetical protein
MQQQQQQMRSKQQQQMQRSMLLSLSPATYFLPSIRSWTRPAQSIAAPIVHTILLLLLLAIAALWCFAAEVARAISSRAR